jgi:hypothetical protein
MIRRSVVAGQFYPGGKTQLAGMIEKFFLNNFGTLPKIQRGEKTMGALCPHAGYPYSGSTAAYSFFEIARQYPDTFIIIGPNHRGIGPPFAIQTEGSWETPLGIAKIDCDSAHSILKKSKILEDNSRAFVEEHSLEVQLPFIQFLGDAEIVPITMYIHDDEDSSVTIGRAIAETVRESKKRYVILASSDLTHFGWQYGFVPVKHNELEWIQEADMKVLHAVEKLDTVALLKIGEKHTCGLGCIMTMIETVKMLGATKGRILKYSTSYDHSHSLDAVVGYGSLLVE